MDIEQRAFCSWRDNLPPEERAATFERIYFRLTEAGFLPSLPPAGFWSLSEEEREPYEQALEELKASERWQEASLIVRELWLETIGALQEEQQGAAMTEDEELEEERAIKLRHFQDWLEGLSPEEYRAWANGQERMLARQHEELSEKWRIWAEQLAPVSELPESRD